MRRVEDEREDRNDELHGFSEQGMSQGYESFPNQGISMASSEIVYHGMLNNCIAQFPRSSTFLRSSNQYDSYMNI